MADSKLVLAVEKASGKEIIVPDGMTKDEVLTQSVLRDVAGPNYVAGRDLIAWGRDFTQDPDLLNKTLDNFAVKYAMTFMKYTMATHPLSMFYRGILSLGGKIEGAVFNPSKPVDFSMQTLGVENPWAVKFVEKHADTYTFLFSKKDKATIVDTVDDQYFNDYRTFNDWVYGNIASLVNGMVLSEMQTLQTAILNAIYEGKLTSIDAKTGATIPSLKTATAGTAPTTLEMATTMKQIEADLQYYSSKYNSLKWQQGTAAEQIWSLVPSVDSVNIDMQLGANMFNADLLYDQYIKRFRVPVWPDLWKYSKDHVVTPEDISSDFVDGNTNLIGSTIKAGSVAAPGATDAFKALDGSAIKPIVLDQDVIQMWDKKRTRLRVLENPYDDYYNVNIRQATYMVIMSALNNAVLIDTSKLITAPSGTGA